MQASALGALILVIGGGIFYNFWQRGKQAEAALTIKGRTPPVEAAAPLTSYPDPSETRKPSLVSPEALVVVHIAGAVKNPGLYRLPPSARVDDAIKKAGGAKPGADLDALNLAERVQDGSKIQVRLRGLDQPSETPATTGNGTAGTQQEKPESTKGSKFTRAGKESLNINTATAETLQRLPGVGPAMADRIIAHRKENGPFTDPEQLMDVSGIGEKKFGRMRPFVRVR